MNTIIMNIDDNTDINVIYSQLKKQYPKIEIIKNNVATDTLKVRNHEKFMKAMQDLNGSIDDPTFIEPSEVEHEAARKPII